VINLYLLRKPPLKKNPLKNLLQKRVKKNGEQRGKADGVIGPRMTPLGVYPRGYRLQVQTTSKNKPYNK